MHDFSPELSTVHAVYCVVARDSHGKTLSCADLENLKSEAGEVWVLKRVAESQKGKNQKRSPQIVSVYTSDWCLNHMWETDSEQFSQWPKFWTQTRLATKRCRNINSCKKTGRECAFTWRMENNSTFSISEIF